MAKKSKRLSRFLASGKTPFACPNGACDRVFASERDREHHVADTHDNPKYQPKSKAKDRTMSRRHHHQNDNVTVLRRQPEQPAGAFTSLFKKPKNDELFVVDFATPSIGLTCKDNGCKLHAIPLTGFCLVHDPLCVMIALGRAIRAEEAEQKANAKPPVMPKANSSVVAGPGGGDFWGDQVEGEALYGHMFH